MIITRISEGLGNQLFQYAAGRALALRAKLPLKLDTHFYRTNSNRSFGLSSFSIDVPIASTNDFKKLSIPDPAPQDSSSKIYRKLFRFLERFLPFTNRRFIVEKGFVFDPTVAAINYPCYLAGIWQSECYFSDAAETIRKDLTLKETPSSSFTAWENKINEQVSISLHVRRGDYVANENANALHGTVGLEYYTKAMENIARTVPNPTVFVFSDDLEWAQKHLALPFPCEYVSGTDLADYEELVLMSRCSHHIIANSSFSWWGAWLGEKIDSITIAPRAWFKDQSINTSDLIPDRWIRL